MVGIFLEPLNTNDRFFFSYTNFSDRTVWYSIITVDDVTEVDVYKHYTTLTNLCMKYLMMCKVYTDVGGIKIVIPYLSTCT